MDRQGGQTGQFNRNANMQNGVEPRETNRTLRLFSSSVARNGSGQRFHDRFSASIVGPNRESANMVPANNESVGAMGMMNISSSSSLPGGSDQRLPGRLSGSNLLLYPRSGSDSFTPSNDHRSAIIPPPHGIASTAGSHAGDNNNNRYNNNQNVSLDLSLHPYGAQNQGTADSSSSVLNAITGTGAPEQVGDGGSANASRRMPFKRTPDYAFREFVIGESSSAGGAAQGASGIPKRRAANDNNVHSSATCTCTTCPLHGSSGTNLDGGVNAGGRGASSWSISEVQQALQAESFQSNIDLQAASANPLSFVQQPSMLPSLGYMRSDSHVLLPGQQPLSNFYQHSVFSRAETTSVPAYCSVHQFENLPHYRDSQYTPSWTNIMRPRSAPSVSFPRSVNMGGIAAIAPFQSARNNVMGGSEAIAPFQSARSNVPGNFMLGPRIGRGNLVQNPPNLSSSGRNHANFAGSFSHPSSSSGQNGSMQRGVLPAFHQLSNIARAWIQRLNVHEEYLRISSAGQPAPPSDPSQVPQVNFSTGLGNPVLENEHRPVVGAENQAGGNNAAPLPPYIADPNRLRQEIRNAIEHLRNGGSIRLEELLILDYSIVLNLLESVTEIDEPNLEEMPYEALLNMEEQIGNAEIGLTENEVLTYIGREIFQSIAEETQQNDACSICQEDYAHGDELGRLDCGHRYHLGCIKQWLLLKNTCPICKQMALTIIDDDEEDDE